MSFAPSALRQPRGSVLIIVLWICLGLVALTLYFANSMSSELRAADNRAMEISARQAVAGAERYAAHVLTTYMTNGTVPAATSATAGFPYQAENLAVGDAHFWFIGRDPNLAPATEPVFGLFGGKAATPSCGHSSPPSDNDSYTAFRDRTSRPLESRRRSGPGRAMPS